MSSPKMTRILGFLSAAWAVPPAPISAVEAVSTVRPYLMRLFVGEHDVGENRPGLEPESSTALRALRDHIRPDDIGGHQVRRKLDPALLERETLRQDPNEQGFSET